MLPQGTGRPPSQNASVFQYGQDAGENVDLGPDQAFAQDASMAHAGQDAVQDDLDPDQGLAQDASMAHAGQDAGENVELDPFSFERGPPC